MNQRTRLKHAAHRFSAGRWQYFRADRSTQLNQLLAEYGLFKVDAADRLRLIERVQSGRPYSSIGTLLPIMKSFMDMERYRYAEAVSDWWTAFISEAAKQTTQPKPSP